MQDLKRLEIIFQYVFISNICPSEVRQEIEKLWPSRCLERQQGFPEKARNQGIQISKETFRSELCSVQLLLNKQTALVDIYDLWISSGTEATEKQAAVTWKPGSLSWSRLELCREAFKNAATQSETLLSPKLKPSPILWLVFSSFLVQIYFIFS